MKFTNKNNLPQYLFDWLTRDEYDYNPDVISATALMKPAKATYLARLHKDNLEMDCADLVASRYGTAIHDSFEKARCGDRREERITAEFNGFKISGKFDMIIDNKLHDFKSTSVWKYIHKEFDDYITQMSIYRWLLHKNNEEVEQTAQICFLFTDWSGSKAKFDKSYPKCRCAVVDIPLWDYITTMSYIGERLTAIHSIDFENLPDCTDKELWKTPDVWAVKKKGNKKAIKLYSSEKEAEDALKEGQEIEHRIGMAKRCKYCNVRPFCQQATEMRKRGLIEI